MSYKDGLTPTPNPETFQQAEASDIEIGLYTKSGERVDFIINASPRRSFTGEVMPPPLTGCPR